ncbi:MAG: right-handed parallel beta-helix repeat-containing protein [Chloroflexi bacterium]|nr:right-handed parallel beta-helix repeat-containing protein [Chloroflexota bacterium]
MNLGKYKHIVFTVAVGSLLLIGLFLLLNGTSRVARADSGDLFVSPGGAGTTCSQADPCTFQTALGLAMDGDAIYVAGGTYTGSGSAVISITQSITLCGGWNGFPTSLVVHDPNLYPTTLDGEGQRRVVYVNENVTPTIDGFIITRGSATALGGGLTAGSEAGGGLYSRNASPIIQNNIITNNVASTQPGVRAFGGGIYISSDATSAIIRSNQIFSNTAGIEIEQGDGGGLFINGTGDISSNIFRDNEACKTCSSSNGGGAYIGWTDSGILIANNLFENNQANRGGGIDIVWSAAQVNKNTFMGNMAVFGAGLDSYYDKGSNITANVIMSNTASGPGNGLRIYITRGPEATRLVNNIIVNNQGPSGAGLYAYSDWNISAITMTHNTLVSNGAGIKIGSNMTATLVNNIVASHTVGIEVTDPSGNVFADHTLFWGNTDDGIRGASPVDSDPAFVNPGVNDYHIGPDSGAIDNGVNAGVTADIDGDPRPAGVGYDIGADEFMWKSYLPLVVKYYP